MDQKKIILVTGATGAQGGSVAKFLLKEGAFAVRCLTRNPASGEAMELAQAGAEIVQGSFDDMDSLLYAMQNVYGVFGVTNFWEHFEKELQHGKNLVNAVAASNIDHFIYSSLPAAEKISKGRYKLPHFDIKAEIQAYAKSLKPASSFVHVAGYYENFASFSLPQKAADGNYYLQFPQGDTKYAACSVEDLGGVIRAMFRFPEAYKKRTVGVVGADMHFAEYAAIMSKVLGINVLYKNISPEEYIAQGFPGAEELGNMYTYNKLHITDRQLDLIESYGLYPGIQSFENWMIKNKKLFKQVLQSEEEAINHN